jgi:hypothetical protein
MAETHVLSALRDKRAELSGLILDLEKKIGRYRVDLVHLDATMRLFDADCQPENVSPRRPAVRNGWFGQGECLRLVYDVLRGTSGPVAASEIARRLMEMKEIDAQDRAAASLFLKTVRNTLARARDTVESVPGKGKAVAWRIKANAR